MVNMLARIHNNIICYELLMLAINLNISQLCGNIIVIIMEKRLDYLMCIMLLCACMCMYLTSQKQEQYIQVVRPRVWK